MTETERKNKLFNFRETRDFLPIALVLTFVILTVFQLRYQGRIWWCSLGDPALLSGDAWGSHNSQHLFDPYSLTHLLHGVSYFWLTGLIFRKMPVARRFAIAIFLGCAWEIVENSSVVIEHYRTATLALNYYGDSIFNSIGDVFSCGVGFVVACKLKFWRSLALFLIVETILLIWIHDSLLLNIVMLIHPFEAIKAWQSK